MGKRWPFSIQDRLSRFYRINGCLKHRKNRIRNRQCRSKFLEAEVKQNTKTKTESYVLDLSNGFSCCWNENRQLGDLPQADFGRVHENTSLSIRKKSTTENFVKRKLRSLSVSVMVRRIFFILSFIRDALYDFFFRGSWNLNFHFMEK